MIGQAAGHGGGTSHAPMLGFAQLMMHHTEIVAASDQIHPRLKHLEATSSMTRCARQAGQSFAKGAIQPFDESGVEDHAATRAVKQILRLLHKAVGYLAGDLDHAFFLRSLDHGANVHVFPDLQARPSNPFGELDLLAERSQNTVGVSTPAVRQDEQGPPAGGTSAHEARSRASARWRSRDTCTTPPSHSSPEFHRLAHGSGPVALARQWPDAHFGSGLPLDLANQPPYAHPTQRHGQSLEEDTHRRAGSPR